MYTGADTYVPEEFPIADLMDVVEDEDGFERPEAASTDPDTCDIDTSLDTDYIVEQVE
jgi:hypothetical protein